jgi:light-regulated signal transduction histidine kinase (bacteriophytochrome)
MISSRFATSIQSSREKNVMIFQLLRSDIPTGSPGKLVEETGAQIEVPHPLPKIPADAVLIRQLLRNLIIHTVKHHREDTPLRIVIRTKPIAETEIMIELENNGAGIETENDKAIFKMTLRSHLQQHDEETGTGLAVCKKIVDRHGGRIGVTSNATIGSTLWFTLPGSTHSAHEQTMTVS